MLFLFVSFAVAHLRQVYPFRYYEDYFKRKSSVLGAFKTLQKSTHSIRNASFDLLSCLHLLSHAIKRPRKNNIALTGFHMLYFLLIDNYHIGSV